MRRRFFGMPPPPDGDGELFRLGASLLCGGAVGLTVMGHNAAFPLLLACLGSGFIFVGFTDWWLNG